MAARMTPRFRDLTDVDWETFADGEVATYGSGTDTLTGEPGGGDAVADLATHAADTTNVHGIADTTVLASDAELAAHIADQTFVHGVSNTADLATDAEVASAVSTHSADTTSVHGITDTTVLATDAEVATAVAAHESDTTVHGIDTANVPSAGEKAALAGTSGTPSVSNKYVTEDDPGLGGADLSDAVVLAPDASARNVVQPSDDVVPLTVKGNASQTDSLQEWQNSAGDTLAVLYPDGGFQTGDFVNGAVLMAPTGELAAYVADTSGVPFFTSLASDGVARLRITGAGAVELGNGLDPLDTTLARSDVGELSLNGEPVVVDDDTRLTDARTPTAHSHAEADVTNLVTDLEGKQPLDSDLTAIAALTTTSYGRGLLGLADQAALLAAAGAQASDADLTAIAALTTTSFGRGLLALADAAALLSAAGAQASDASLTAFAALTTAANKGLYFTGADTPATYDLTAAGRALLDDADAAAQLTTLGVSTFIKTLLDDTDAATARTTLGVTSGGVAPRYPAYISGKYYGVAQQGTPAATAGSMFQSRAIYTPFCVDVTTTFDRIGIEVGATVASLVYRLGIYNYSMTTGYPGTLVLDAGTVVGSTTGEQFATISQQLTAGWYYLVCVPQAVAIGAATVYQCRLQTASAQYPIPQTNFRGNGTLLYRESVTGALPDPALTVSVTEGFIPNVMLRAA